MNTSTKSIAATLVAAGLIAGSQLAASAAGTVANTAANTAVAVSADAPIALSATLWRAVSAFPGTAEISFTNTRDVAATDVIFALDADGAYAGQIEDVGTFTKGATIRHEFPDPSASRDQHLSLAKVTFADGSVWQNDAQIPAVPVRQAGGSAPAGSNLR